MGKEIESFGFVTEQPDENEIFVRCPLFAAGRPAARPPEKTCSP